MTRVRSAESPGFLPARAVDTFVGRHDLLSRVTKLLSGDRARLVTLTGVGGVGKTHLAIAAAATVRNGYRDGVWLVDLTPHQDPVLVPTAIAITLGKHDHEHDTVETLTRHLAGKSTLLVLDNCEHVIDSVARTVAALLDAAPEVRIMVTSRAPLRIDGEHVVEVLPLEVPPLSMEQAVSTAGATATAMPYDSVRLLIDRAESAGAVDFGRTADPVLVARLVRRLNGIPLGIVLAAARLRSLSVEDILRDPTFSLLSRGQRDAQDHHQSLNASIEWSHRLCAPASRVLWARLGVFTGPFTLDSATAVCADDPDGTTVNGVPVIAVLDDLVQESVVSQHHDAGQSRYYLLDMMRDFALDQLDGAEAQRWRRRHAAHYRQAALHAARTRFSDQELAVVAGLRRDMPHYRAALDWCLSQPDQAETALTIVCALSRATAWFTASSIAEGSRYLVRALDLPGEAPELLRLMAIAQLAWHGIMRGMPDTEQWIDRCYREAPPAGLPYAHFVRGLHLLFVHADPAAVTTLSEAVEGFRHAGTPVFFHLATLYLALAALRFDEPVVADTASRQCLENAEKHNAVLALSWANWVRGHIEIGQGAIASARERLQSSLRTHQRLGTHWGLEWLVEALSWVAAIAGHHEHAAQLLGGASVLRGVTGEEGSGLATFVNPRNAAEDLLHAALSPADYATAFSQGAAMTFDDVISLALGEVTGVAAEPAPESERAAWDIAESILTSRQLEVARLIAQDLSNEEIARRLYIGKRTVESHVRAIYDKVGVRSRLGIATWFAEVLPRHTQDRDI